jgi:hypothetical protein
VAVLTSAVGLVGVGGGVSFICSRGTRGTRDGCGRCPVGMRGDMGYSGGSIAEREFVEVPALIALGGKASRCGNVRASWQRGYRYVIMAGRLATGSELDD